MRFILLFFLALIFSISCNKKSSIKEIEGGKESVDWVGVYKGVFPCNDCEKINATLTLTQDNTYGLEYIYLGESTDTLSNYGFLRWNSNESKIQLVQLKDENNVFLVQHGKLVQQNELGKPDPKFILKKY